MSAFRRSKEYSSFRSTVSQRKIVVDTNDEVWTVYDAGPRSVRSPLICLPPVSCYADVFFQQVLTLSSLGYRVIAVDYPVCWNHKTWCESFRKLLDNLRLDKVHIFGASLGGFLGQKFAEFTANSPRVHSLVLCNAFVDTSVFQRERSASAFWAMPSFVLKKWVLSHMPSVPTEPVIADSVDFVVEELEEMSRNDLAARLTLNCSSGYVEPQKLKDVLITIIDVFDESALSVSVKEEVYKFYPDAKRAHLKSGGNFPYLSHSAEVNLHTQIHLKMFEDTRFSAKASTNDD